jgi:hypothetical protein
MATSFSGGGSWSTRREPRTMSKQLVNFITCGCESSAPFFCNLQSCARTHAVLVIGLYELLEPTTQLIESPGPLHLCMFNDICMCVYMFTDICMCVCMFNDICMCLCMFNDICMCLYMFNNICMCLYMFNDICMHLCMLNDI